MCTVWAAGEERWAVNGYLREAVSLTRDESPLSGEVQVDGAYVGGSVRPANRKEDRVDRRLAENQNPDKRCILVMRENYTQDERRDGFQGAKRTLASVIVKEAKAPVSALAARFIKPGSTVSADEAEAYDPMHARYQMQRVNHSQEYRAADGTTNNQAESYFSRFRRMQFGQIHRVTHRYLDRYADEIGYREDTRRWPNGRIFLDLVGKCAHARTSRDWCGYWQGNKRLEECLAA